MNQIVKQQETKGDLLEKVIMNNDLAGLTPLEKVTHIKNICDSLGLNPFTKPFQLLKFQGKEVIYATKDASEQLRKNHSVSITNIDTKLMADGLYIVTASAALPTGRSDSSTGVISTKGMAGDILANAMMKAETKAKRRVTLSICGLGFLDESETETMKGAVKLDHNPQTGEIIEPIKIEHKSQINDDLSALADFCSTMKSINDMDTLKELYVKAARRLKNNQAAMEQLTKAKDEAKERIELAMDDARFANVIQPSEIERNQVNCAGSAAESGEI